MKNVGIICGGYSSEFDISIKSARNILENFPDTYQVFLLIMNKDGWFVEFEGQKLIFDQVAFSFQSDELRVYIDLAIVYTHGDPGENGKLQAYLEMIDVPYVNSGPLASHLSFDKWYCNQFLKGFEVPVAKSIYLNNEKEMPSVEHIVSELNLPLFVKPCDSGSSYGISRVNKSSDLLPAIKDAFAEGDSIVLESYLDGVEITCGVYRNMQGVQALPLTEIVSENEFFDYDAKYSGKSKEITPARIDDNLKLEVQKMSREIYQLLNLRSIARVDFMIVDGKPHVIEVNTTPGFSLESIVPKMLETAGLSIKDFWSEIMTAELV